MDDNISRDDGDTPAGNLPRNYRQRNAAMRIGIVCFFTCVIAILWAVTLRQIAAERDKTIKDEFVGIGNLALAMEAHAFRTIENVDQALMLIKHNIEQSDRHFSIHSLAAQGLIDESLYHNLVVIDEHGNLVQGTTLPTAAVNFSDRAYFKAIQEQKTDSMLIGEPIVGRITRQWAIPMIRRINKADGSFGGIAYAGVSPESLTGFYRKTALEGRDSLTLVGMDGIVRARLSGGVTSYGQNMAAQPFFARIATSSTGGYIGDGKFDGVRRFVSYRALKNYPLVVLIGTDYDAVMADTNLRRSNYLFGAGIFTLCVLIFCVVIVRFLRNQCNSVVKLAESELHLRATFCQPAVGICHIAPNGDIFEVNEKLCAIAGYRRDELVGMNIRQIVPADDLHDFEADSHTQEKEPYGAYSREHRIVQKDGAQCWVNRGLSPVRDAFGSIRYYIVFLQDITERKTAELQLAHQANFDRLTELPNRILFHDRLNQAINHSHHRHGVVGVVFFDLDRFKVINDTLGHAAGDQLLRLIARRLCECVRTDDTVSRLGGDEFAIVLTSLHCSEDVNTISRKIINAMHAPFQFDGHEVFVTASIGVACSPLDGVDADALMRNADTALFRAKAAGRDNYHLYTADMNAKALQSMELERGLHQALEKDEFAIYFQPQANLATHRIVGAEALLRWLRPGVGVLSPAEFIPILEETGMIVPVGAWVLHAACRQIRAWLDSGIQAVPIAVNLSAKQFQHQDIAALVAEALREYAIPASLLELEITESVAMNSADETIVKLRELKALGVTISIDDFGTGYSSLAYLKRFPVDALKIDRSFVIGLPQDADDAAIARAIITLAHSLRLKVIAEGVENNEQRQFLAALDCDQMQGYLLSPPVPAQEFIALLHRYESYPEDIAVRAHHIAGGSAGSHAAPGAKEPTPDVDNRIAQLLKRRAAACQRKPAVD
ncbi:MAG TPA: EAL domain-containing protein [Burkholderiaceae bacterium]